MKGPLVVSLVALALSVVALTGTFPALHRGASSSDAAALSGPEPDAQLAERVERLSAENRALRERLTELEMRSVPERREPASGLATKDELAALREELAELRAELAAAPGSTLTARPVEASNEFKQEVARTLGEIRKQERVDRVRSQMDRRLEELDQTMPKINEWLGLTSYQSNEMRSALLKRYEREADLIRRWEAGEDPEVLGLVKEADRSRRARARPGGVPHPGAARDLRRTQRRRREVGACLCSCARELSLPRTTPRSRVRCARRRRPARPLPCRCPGSSR